MAPWVAAWFCGNVVLLLTGKPSRYLSNHLCQLSLPSLRGKLIKYHAACLSGRRGVFTCVGWQVTLCDPIRQVTPSSSQMTCSGELYRLTV